jgi:hypothetical protein
MDIHVITSNLLSPPILFFFLGMIAVALKSDLDMPQPLPKLLSMYLLLSIGFKGGVELRHSAGEPQVILALLAAMGMALAVPLYSFFILRRRMDVNNAAAIAATYGSVSAVTFITATAFLDQLGVQHGGHMVAGMALMESPAIIVGVALARMNRAAEGEPRSDWRELMRESIFNGSVLLLIGSLCIGLLTGDAGGQALLPFTDGIFKGMLCLFLLDMGLVSARRIANLKQLGAFPIGFALLVPLFNAAVAMALSRAIGMSAGDALLFTVLCASASYIAVPAAMRLALPEANPGVYVSMALAITFPFNVALGIPLYMALINQLWR